MARSTDFKFIGTGATVTINRNVTATLRGLKADDPSTRDDGGLRDASPPVLTIAGARASRAIEAMARACRVGSFHIRLKSKPRDIRYAFKGYVTNCYWTPNRSKTVATVQPVEDLSDSLP